MKNKEDKRLRITTAERHVSQLIERGYKREAQKLFNQLQK